MSPASSPIRSADIALIEAEVRFRLEAELQRHHAEAELLRVSEIARVETEALEHETRAIERISALAKQELLRETARIEGDMALRLKRAEAEGRVAGEAEAREALQKNANRAIRDADAAAARVSELEADLARVRTEAEATNKVGRQEADAAAARVSELEADLARVRTETEAANKAARQEVRLIRDPSRGREPASGYVKTKNEERATCDPPSPAQAARTDAGERDHSSADAASARPDIESLVKPWVKQARDGAEHLRKLDALMMDSVGRREVHDDATLSRYRNKISEIIAEAEPEPTPFDCNRRAER